MTGILVRKILFGLGSSGLSINACALRRRYFVKHLLSLSIISPRTATDSTSLQMPQLFWSVLSDVAQLSMMNFAASSSIRRGITLRIA